MTPLRIMMHRVAGHLGITVRRLKVEMMMREFLDWCEFAALEPIGGHRMDVNTGHIVATICNAFGDPKNPTKLSDDGVVLDWDAARDRVTEKRNVGDDDAGWMAAKMTLDMYANRRKRSPRHG